MYEKLSGKSFPATVYSEGAWRTDRAAFEAEIARAMIDWGNCFYQDSWDVMKPDLGRLRELGNEYGFELLVVLFPATQQVEAEFLADEPQRMFEAVMAEVDAPRVDLLPALRQAYRTGGESLAYDQCHLTPEGNSIVARAIAIALKDAPLIRGAAPEAINDR